MLTNLKIGYNGRFGNQIFQFAALLGIANRVGCRAVIPFSNINVVTQKTMDGKYFSARFELHDCFEIENNFFSNDIRLQNSKIENSFHFDEEFFHISDFSNIEGYFQTDRYFKHIEVEIKSTLKFKNTILEKAEELLPKLQSKELVSVHVRRGDYTTPNPYHPVVSENYLTKCINYFYDEKYHFVIFSDDIEWCKNYWGVNEKISYFSSDSNFVDFCAMSLCEHHIISNSSFSWWTSHLSKNKNKKVLAPKKWFGPGLSHYNTEDLYRDEMIIVDELDDIIDNKISIDIFTICTGKYINYFQQFYNSCETNFLSNYQKKYFVFTDGNLPNLSNVVKIYQPKLGWPYDTMMRFKMFNSIKEKLTGDYVYFFNINMSFRSKIDEIVIPKKENDYLMGVNHPGYYNENSFNYPYERTTSSNFFVPYGIGEIYFQGCFNGGRRSEFMLMSEELEKLIDDDLSKNIIPVWHDESALNWYYINKNPLVLDPSFAYPESTNIPFDRKVVQLDKNKIGGHFYLRS